MDKLLAFLRARWAERSSRVQVIVLVLLLLVAGGVLTFEQIEGWTTKALALAGVLGPLMGFLVPDGNKAVEAAAAADEAVDAALAIATEAAEKAAGPGAREASLAVSQIVDKLLP